MLSATLDVAAAVRQIDALESALARQMPRLLGDVGRATVARVERDFLVKARGGRGADGTTWPALSPMVAKRKQRRGTPQIGVATGNLFGSFAFRVGGRTAWGKYMAPGAVYIENLDQPKANFFNVHRRLFPSRLPNGWHRDNNLLVQATLDEVADSILS